MKHSRLPHNAEPDYATTIGFLEGDNADVDRPI